MDITSIWGSGETLLPVQMGLRAFVMFLLALVLIRLGGIRIFGQKSVLDYIIVIMLGAIMARGVVGASPFIATVAAAAVLIFTNWLLAYGSRRSKWWSLLIKGRPYILFQNGSFNRKNMQRSNLAEEDIFESLRLEIGDETLQHIDKVFLENNGRISFVRKEMI